MALILKGDIEINEVKSSKAKALKVNLNKRTYGTFAEIGAGQETVRHFFRAGGASGTIASVGGNASWGTAGTRCCLTASAAPLASHAVARASALPLDFCPLRDDASYHFLRHT